MFYDRVLRTALVIVAVSVVAGGAPAEAFGQPRMYRPHVTTQGDGSHFLVWQARAGLHVLRDGVPWGDAAVYPIPHDCPRFVVGTGHVAFACNDSEYCGGLPWVPRIMELATGTFRAIQGLRELTGSQCSSVDEIARVGAQVIEFSSSTYHAEGTPYSWNWRTGHGVSGRDEDRFRHAVVDFDSPTGLRRLCRPLVASSTMRSEEDFLGDTYPINDPAWFERPFLISAAANGLFMQRCGQTRRERLARAYSTVAVTRDYVAWAPFPGRRLVLRMLRSRRQYVWHLPPGEPSLSGTRGTLTVLLYRRRNFGCPCARRAVDLIRRRAR